MDKKIYDNAKMQIIHLKNQDVITVSDYATTNGLYEFEDGELGFDVFIDDESGSNSIIGG